MKRSASFIAVAHGGMAARSLAHGAEGEEGTLSEAYVTREDFERFTGEVLYRLDLLIWAQGAGRGPKPIPPGQMTLTVDGEPITIKRPT